MQQAQNSGLLKCIKLAWSTPTITHAMYADDLVIMGQAANREVAELKAILEEFATHTGLIINPDKSKI